METAPSRGEEKFHIVRNERAATKLSASSSSCPTSKSNPPAGYAASPPMGLSRQMEVLVLSAGCGLRVGAT
jgi:hypothetical protein